MPDYMLTSFYRANLRGRQRALAIEMPPSRMPKENCHCGICGRFAGHSPYCIEEVHSYGGWEGPEEYDVYDFPACRRCYESKNTEKK